MLSEFEQRLITVLGNRLNPPFRGQVERPPGSNPGTAPMIVVGVVHAEETNSDMGSRRPERVPGADDPRRVVRLRCSVQLEVRPASNGRRPQQLEGLDACLYALTAPDFQNGQALAGDAADPGFVIQSMRLAEGFAPFAPSTPEAPLGLRLLAEGWFWPAAEPGQAGRQIGEIRVHGLVLPVEVSPVPQLKAGQEPVDLGVRIGSSGMRLVAGGPAEALPFGRLAFALEGEGGQPGHGTLSGGDAGAAGVRLVSVTDGMAQVRYTPPAAPAVDQMVIGLDDGQDGLGIEIARLALRVT